MPQPRAELVRQVRRQRRDQPHERRGRVARQRVGLGDLAHEDHQLRDGRIEAQRLEILGHVADGSRQQLGLLPRARALRQRNECSVVVDE